MADDLILIVDSVSGSPATLVNLNDGTTWLMTYESDLTPAKLQRATVNNLMVDGSYDAATSYPDMTFKLVLESKSANADAAELATQSLARELDRDDRFLAWQPAGATNPVFFQMRRSDFDSIREVPGTAGYRKYEVALRVAPFAIGLPVTAGPFTLNFNPAAVSNGCFFDVTSVKGDVDTPLILSTTDTDLSIQPLLIGVRSRGTPANMTWFRQAEALTMGTDTSVQANSAAASGAGSNWVRCTFGSDTTMVARVSGTFPTTGSGSVDWRGQYRVIARMKGAAAVNARVVISTATGTVIGDTYDIAGGSTEWIHYDLGVIQLPPSRGRRIGYSSDLAIAGVALQLQAERPAGSGNLDIDYISLVPADEYMSIVQLGSVASSGSQVIDGVRNEVYRLNSSGEIVGEASQVLGFDGRLPRVDPRATTNRVFIYATVYNPTFGTNIPYADPGIGNSASINVTYYPLYRYLRPAST